MGQLKHGAPNNDTKGCQKNVTAVWPSMAKAIFSNTHLVPIKVCQNLKPAHCMNATKQYQMPTRDAKCDDCKTFIKTISTADCQGFNSWFTAKAFNILGQVVGMTDSILC